MTTKEPKDRATAKAGGSFVGVLTLAIGLVWVSASLAQLPGIPSPAKPAPAPKADPSKSPIPAKGSPGAVFATTSGPIAVDKKVDDSAIETTLTDLLRQFPGVYSDTVEVHAREGAVRLNGHVDDNDTLDDVTAFSEKVEGVRLVLNRMKTEDEFLSGRQKAMKVLRQYAADVEENWLLVILAIVCMAAFGMLARTFARSSEMLLTPLIRNSLLRSVVGSILSTLIVSAGVVLGLSVMKLTHAVVSVLGLAGVVGLALGFAFKDIAENFIASMLLGVRRPFQIGDFITVAGKSGSVLALNTRETMLITPEGNHVRIPNAVIYKETLINASTTPSSLGTIDVKIPYEASAAEALDAINEALQSTDGLLQEPTPRALVQSLEADGVHLRATYWMPTRGIDGDKLQSDLRLKIKVALQKVGSTPPPPVAAAPAPVDVQEPHPTHGDHAHAEPQPPAIHLATVAAAHQAEANLRKDAEAAEHASAEVSAPEASPIDHAIHQAEVNAIAEGNNMLVNAKS